MSASYVTPFNLLPVSSSREAPPVPGGIVPPIISPPARYGEPVVAIDTTSAAPGQIVYVVEKREAAKAFGGPQLPSDVTILGIVDELSVQS